MTSNSIQPDLNTVNHGDDKWYSPEIQAASEGFTVDMVVDVPLDEVDGSVNAGQ